MPLLFAPNPQPYRPHLPSFRQPLYLHLRPLWLALERTLRSCEGRVLDVGCGLQPYRPFLNASRTEYVGLDREGPLSRPTVIGSAEALPFDDQSFDVVLATQLLEHVPDPRVALREAVRVLRIGGRIVLTVPGVWPTHEAPHDYWRFPRYGLLRLLEETGIECTELVALGKLWATVGQLTNLALHRNVVLRELVPAINLTCSLLDRLPTRDDLVLNWLADGRRAR
jgi:SAM-dependent methyltransferase